MLKKSLLEKLNRLNYRHQELNTLLSDLTVIRDKNRYRDLNKEFSDLNPVLQCFKQYQMNHKTIELTQNLLTEDDIELKKLAEEELQNLNDQHSQLEYELQNLLLPNDPNDKRNVFLEIRAGTGGDEAAIFAGDLFRMYARFVERKGWKLTIVSNHVSEQGGYKEVIARIVGQNVFSQLKFESGAHRVQRVSATESQGRIHTSACTVAIMPEVDEIESINIDPSDLRIDTFRASGAGGQHVNRTDSAVRITHLPSGTVVECQDERSQHKNKSRAMLLLQSKIVSSVRDKRRREQAKTRRSLIGSGDRSERIRTYNYPQTRVSDHRINLTLYQLHDVMDGALDPIIQPLISEFRVEQMTAATHDE